jgi:hypothetical protein
MSQEYRRLNGSTPMQVYTKIAFIGILVCIAYAVLSKGEFIRYLTWTGETAGIYPDLFESVRDAANHYPYDWKAIYPPLIYTVLYFFSKLVPGDYVTLGGFADASETPNGLLVGTLFLMIVTVAVCVLAAERLGLKNRGLLGLMTVLVFSPAYLFMLERGNVVILALLFLEYYTFNYESDDPVKRELALIALAFATCMKLYPVIFGVLLLRKDKLKEATRCIVYGLVLFIVPFFAMGGLKEIPHLFENITKISADTIASTKGFGYGFKVNVGNIWGAITGLNGSGVELVGSILLLVVVVQIVAVVLLAQEKWEKIYGLTMILTLIPSFSWIYNEIYLLIPFVLYFAAHKTMKRSDWVYIILFSLITVPLPYASFFNSLPGFHKVSLSTLTGNVAMLALLLLLCVKSVAAFVQARTSKSESYPQDQMQVTE